MIFFQIMRRNAIKLVGERSASFDLARGRLLLLGSVFVLMYMLLAVRLVDVSLVQGRFWGHGEDTKITRYTPQLDQRRGRIYDRNGHVVATSLRVSSLYADPQHIADPAKTAASLVHIFPELSVNKVQALLGSKKRFVWVKRAITPSQQEAVLNIGEPGLGFREGYQRVYPYKHAFSHLVGMTNIDGQGVSGAELSLDGPLSKGKDVRLSLDMRLQHSVRREVLAAMTTYEAIGGSGVVMDVRSGEILAGVSLPDFNPHAPSHQPHQQAGFNRLSRGVYELGSVFKIFSTAAYLEAHDVSMGEEFDTRKPLKVGRYTISDYHAQKRILTLPEVFVHSSNIGSALMAQAVGAERLRKLYSDLGLLSRLQLELTEVARPLVPDRWGEIATMTASYGHGIAASPLHVATAVSSIVNGGFWIRPTLLKRAETAQDTHAPIRVMAEETSYQMRELMRLVVTEGTGKKAAVKGYKVGGKTGTAEKSSAGGYDKTRLISSFVAAFPMDDPRYVVYIMIDEPKGNAKSYGYATAGWVAAPAVGRVVRSMASILGMPPRAEPAGYKSPLLQYIAEAN